MTRDLDGKTLAWYRFTETPARVYGPRDLTFVFRTYGFRETCEVALAGADGTPQEPWFRSVDLRARLKSQAVQAHQLKRLAELGVPADPAMLDKIGAAELIEAAELKQPASDVDIRKARAAGADVQEGMTRAQLNRALVDMEADENEAERVSENQSRLSLIRRRGIKLPDDAEDDVIEGAESALQDLDGAIADAKEWGLPARSVPKPQTVADALRLASVVFEWGEYAQRYDADFVEWEGRRTKRPSERTMRAVRMAYLDLMLEGSAPPDARMWTLSRVDLEEAAQREERAAKTPTARQVPRTAPPAEVPASRRESPAGAKVRETSESSRSGLPIPAIVTVVVFIIVAMVLASG